ncbi:MAG: PTS glucose transporter subunit IIA [Erysipelotrichaceae bacterium]|nr:PTS glucose transporter subunit IIA [Erysipelotrichaceae bacterium]
MVLFKNLFNKQEEKVYEDSAIVAVADGKMIPASEIDDEMFSQEMMGQTIGFEISNGDICSPVNGTLEMLFPTKHAFAVKSADGTVFLVHIGIDTVSLNGKGFKSLVDVSSKVKAGQVIVKADLKTIKDAGFPVTTMLVVTEKPEGKTITYTACKEVAAGEIINN